MSKKLLHRSLLLPTLAIFGFVAVPTAHAQSVGSVLRGVVQAQIQAQQPTQPQHYQPQPHQVHVQHPQHQAYYPPRQTQPRQYNQRQNWNPVVIDTGKHVAGITYDPFTGKVIVQSQQQKVRDSYYDQNRHQMDPGSYRQVNRYESDGQGGQWHVTGYQWTTNGKPHGNLQRRRVSNTGVPGVIHDERENVAYSVQQPGNGSNHNTNNHPQHRQHQPHYQPQPVPRTPTAVPYSPF